MKNTRELLAANAHDAWGRWTEHLLEQCDTNIDGSLVIPDKVSNRWRRLIATPYEQLTEQEKASDRVEADLILEILQNNTG